jgi:hypothetical protein
MKGPPYMVCSYMGKVYISDSLVGEKEEHVEDSFIPCASTYAYRMTRVSLSYPGMIVRAAFRIQYCTAYNWISLFIKRTSSPGLKAGSPMYGHPSHLKASPSAQFPQLPTLPWTVKSTSVRSSAPSFNVSSAWSAVARFAASSASSFSFIPQVQSLQARRRFPALGRHSGAGLY